jgi:phosphohistidine phosphatase
MKTLMLMRHAKSDWSDGSLRDFDRPLNDRGESEAPSVGEKLVTLKIKPELFISSPAMRAKMTAIAVAEKVNYNMEKIVWNESFYFGYTSEIIESLKQLDEKISSVIIFGHNPTWSAIAELLTGKFYSLKTAELIILEFNDSWKNLKAKICKEKYYLSPKK